MNKVHNCQKEVKHLKMDVKEFFVGYSVANTERLVSTK
jgi:hypothetical protein